MCREHGQQLSELASLATKTSDDFGFWGIVKETGVDDEGLMEFHNTYFDFPLYRDVDLSAYAAFGNKSILSNMTTWNPFKLYRGFQELNKRLKEKSLEGNMKGEGLTKGGVFVLNPDGEVVYAMEEMTGSSLDMDEIKAAMDALRNKEGATTAEVVEQEL